MNNTTKIKYGVGFKVDLKYVIIKVYSMFNVIDYIVH